MQLQFAPPKRQWLCLLGTSACLPGYMRVEISSKRPKVVTPSATMRQRRGSSSNTAARVAGTVCGHVMAARSSPAHQKKVQGHASSSSQVGLQADAIQQAIRQAQLLLGPAPTLRQVAADNEAPRRPQAILGDPLDGCRGGHRSLGAGCYAQCLQPRVQHRQVCGRIGALTAGRSRMSRDATSRAVAHARQPPPANAMRQDDCPAPTWIMVEVARLWLIHPVMWAGTVASWYRR